MTKQKLDTYLSLCTQVYDLSKPIAPERELAFYRSYAIEAKGAILEPMCGTGRFLLPLVEEGFDVEGFDASEHMLDVLFQKAAAKNLKLNVWNGFIEDLKKSKNYSLIFIPSGSIGLITDLDVAMHALKILHQHLGNDGILIFEGETPQAIPNTLDTWSASEWLRSDGKKITMDTLTTVDGSIYTSIGKYELVDDGKIIHAETEELNVRVYEPHQMIAILNEVGFKAVKMIKAFNRAETPGNADEAIVYECRK